MSTELTPAEELASKLAEEKKRGRPRGNRILRPLKENEITVLKALRESLGLSSTDVAKSVRIVATYYSQLENGKSIPVLSKAYAIARFFGRDVWYFWPGGDTVAVQTVDK